MSFVIWNFALWKFVARRSIAGFRLALVLSMAIAALMAAEPSVAAPVWPRTWLPLASAPMRVRLVRGAYRDCAPQCDEWISVEGTIGAESLALLRRALDATKKRKLPILIHSAGGRADIAMSMGRLIRARGLDVVVARTEFEPAASEPRGWAMSNSAICASGCSMVLAGGVRRFVAPESWTGVHEGVVPAQTVVQTIRYYRTRTFVRGNRIVGREKVFVGEKHVSRRFGRSAPTARSYAQLAAFFIEMGMTKQLYELLHTAPSQSMRWLTPDELLATRLATENRSAETIVHTPRAPAEPPATAFPAATPAEVVIKAAEPAPGSLSAPPPLPSFLRSTSARLHCAFCSGAGRKGGGDAPPPH
jgi:hypothetical protein